MAIINTTTVEEPVAVESDINNQTAFQVQQVSVPIVDTPVQAPSIAVPFTVAVAVQADPNNTNASRIFVANSSANALDATKRLSLSKGQSVSLFVTNANLIWFNTNVAASNAIIVVEA